MTIKASSDKEFVFRYIELLQGRFGFTDREVQVVAAIVHRYKILEQAGEKLQGKKAREEYDPHKMWKSPESLRDLYTNLNMTFEVFRHNLIRLKTKSVFYQGKINKELIPDSLESTTITITNGATE